MTSYTFSSYTVEVFTASATFTPPAGVTSVDLLVVGGGGGGAFGDNNNGAGGGGAGGVRWVTSVGVTPGAGCTVTVGGGGAGASTLGNGTTGGSSSFVAPGGTETSLGGGGGGRFAASNVAPNGQGSNGGSGGGGGTSNSAGYLPAGGTGSAGQGNAGGAGNGVVTISGRRGGGGGGAGAVGQAGTVGCSGGVGVDMSANVGTPYGVSGWFGGGGGGSQQSGATVGTGGTGGGGQGGHASGNPSAGTANTGGGGGAAYKTSTAASAGGSGIVLVRYTALTAPGIPTSVSNTARDEDSLELTWSAPATGGAPSSYEVRLNGGSPSTQTSPYTFTGLSVNTSYTLEVRAVNGAGNSSYVSVSASTYGPPNIPTSVAATPGVFSLEFTWSAPVGGDPVTSYQVRIDGGTPSTATSPHTFTGLAADTTYTLEVRAVGPGGSSSWVAVTPDAETGEAGLWRAIIHVGPHEWTIDRDDDADPDENVLAGMNVGWNTPKRSTYDWSGQPEPDGMVTFPPGGSVESGWPAQPDPWIASVGILTETAAETSDLDVGDKVWIRFYPDGPGEALMVEFAGRIREVTQAPVERSSEDSTPRTITRVTAVDYTIDLADIPVDLTVTDEYAGWPSVDQHADDRWEQAADVAGIPDVSDPPDYPVPLATSTIIGGPGSGTAYTVLRSVAQATRAMLKANVDASGDLDPDHPWVFELYGPNEADGLIHQYVYTDGLTIEDGYITGGGLPAVDVPLSQLEWSRDTLSPGFNGEDGGPYGFPLEGAWTANGLRYIGMDSQRLGRWFTLPEAMSTLIGISGLATYRNPRGVSYYSGRLASASLIVGGRGKWVVDFSLIRTLPDANITWEDTITWDEMPSDITWDDMDPGLTWGDMAAVSEAD